MCRYQNIYLKKKWYYLIINNSNIQISRIYSFIREFTGLNFKYTYVIILRIKNVTM